MKPRVYTFIAFRHVVTSFNDRQTKHKIEHHSCAGGNSLLSGLVFESLEPAGAFNPKFGQRYG
jgi:hypothetical protein